MRFRVRIYSPVGDFDFILPLGHFIFGHNPQRDGQFKITLAYVLDEHLDFETTEYESQVRFLGASVSAEQTVYNGLPLAPHTPVTLDDGDRLIIRDPRDAEQMILLVIEHIEERRLRRVSNPKAPSSEAAKGVLYAGGLKRYSVRMLHYLPEIYQPEQPVRQEEDHDNDTSDTFLARFLGLIESILLPAEWTIGNFDLFLDPKTAPEQFLPWLAHWFGFTTTEWDEHQQRALLAHYPWRGTRRGLQRLLEVYTGHSPQIVDGLELALFQFHVRLPVNEETLKAKKITRASIERLIDETKPVHTTYRLDFVA